MIQTIIEAVVTALSSVSGLAGGVTQHAGDIEALTSQPRRLPALWVLYDGAQFSGRDTVGDDRAEHVMRVTVVLLASSHRSRADAAESAYTIIEAVRDALTGLEVSPHGELWPDREQLIDVEGALQIYAMTYAMTTEHVVA